MMSWMSEAAMMLDDLDDLLYDGWGVSLNGLGRFREEGGLIETIVITRVGPELVYRWRTYNKKTRKSDEADYQLHEIEAIFDE